jgi:hypothetical protein
MRLAREMLEANVALLTPRKPYGPKLDSTSIVPCYGGRPAWPASRSSFPTYLAEIRDEKDSAKVAITYGDARRARVELDVLASEVDDLANKGKKTAKRGRKPKDG